MESNIKVKKSAEDAIYIYINCFFIIVGIFLYLVACLLLHLYYKASNLIKSEIFTYIFFHTFKIFVGIILPIYSKVLFIYCFDIIEFALILSHLNSCFTSKNISENTSHFELKYRYLFILIFMLSTFPYGNFFIFIDQLIFSSYILNLILAILLFRYINIKMNLLLDYFKDKKVTNPSIPELYLPYVKANYYFINFNRVNKIFCSTLILVIIYYVSNIVNLFFDLKKAHKYLMLFTQEFIYYSILISNIILFYCLNKDSLFDNKIPKDEIVSLNKFRVIDVDIQHEEDENILNKKTQNESKNNVKNENGGDDEETLKNGNKKINEESEKLKN